MTGVARLGRDAEVRFLPNGDPVASLALAFNYGKKDGEGKRLTQWVDASLWGERATKLQEYLLKGQQLCVVLNEPHIEEYTKKDNSVGFSLRASVSSIEFVGSPPAPAGEGDSPQQRQAAKSSPAQQPARQTQQRTSSFDDFEDDIPF